MIQSMTILLHGFRGQFCTTHFSVGRATCIKSGEQTGQSSALPTYLLLYFGTRAP